jgi:hypothetical protein
MFTFKDGTTPAQIDEVGARLATLPAAIEQVRRYAFGPDAGVVEGNFDYAVVADFDAAEDYLAYAGHPAHQAFLADVLRPILQQRVAVQFRL